jgi:hypothetical protein
MNNEFTPYEQTLTLKELGFDEPCIMVYHHPYKEIKYALFAQGTDWTKAPLFQQAFRWFREKYNFCYFIRGNNYDGYSYNIDNLGLLQYKFEIEYRFTFKTYEEAEIACLDKLIEIVKNKQMKKI